MERENTTTLAARVLAGVATFATAILVMTAAPATAATCDANTEGTVPILCGSVTSGGAPVGGVTVVLEDSSGNVVATADTTLCNDPGQPCGEYAFLPHLNFDVPQGTYTLCAKLTDGSCGDSAPVVIQTDVDGNSFVVDGSTTPGTPVSSERIDLEFPAPQPVQSGPGTGTPGYWKNHPEAWPDAVKNAGITIGNKVYSQTAAIGWMGKVGGDKSLTIFSSLLSAKLNVMAGNPDSCVADAIKAADAWFITYVFNGMAGKIGGSSVAWAGAGQGDATHQILDNYNNGLLPCAHHRD